MKCPKCNEDMKKGYIYIATTERGWLRWSTKEPPKWSAQRRFVNLLEGGLLALGKENWLRRAYRCEKCGLVVFEEEYTLPGEPSEDEKKQKKPEEV